MKKKQYHYRQPVPVQTFGFNTKEKKAKNGVVKTQEKSIEVRMEQAFQQLVNDVCDALEEDGLTVKFIEKALLKSLLNNFNQQETARIAGVSVRTVRNKLREQSVD